MIRIGTAGWSLPKEWQDRFPQGGTHLHRYAGRFKAVEIDRTLKKTPRPTTFARWAESVPSDFRFSVKVPRRITHDRRLVDVVSELDEFLEIVGRLGDRLGPLLVQLPPRPGVRPHRRRGVPRPATCAARRARHARGTHESWFIREAEELLADRQVARVAADPPRASADGAPGGARTLAYFRLHGQPRTYYSAYRDGGLERWARAVHEVAKADGTESVWCIFDNTAAGEATGEALALQNMLGDAGGG